MTCNCQQLCSDIGIEDCKELREVLSPLAQQGVEALVQPPPTTSSAPVSPKASVKVSGVPLAVVGAPHALARMMYADLHSLIAV